MAEHIRVVSIHGTAWVVGRDGQMHALRAGQRLQVGDVVATGRDGQLAIAASAEGEVLMLEASRPVRLDEQMFAQARPQAEHAALGAQGIEQITRIIEGGDVLEAPAAGGGENAGSAFVRLLRIVEPVDPLAFAFETALPDLRPW